MKRTILLPAVMISLLSPVAMANNDTKGMANGATQNGVEKQEADPIKIILQDHDYIKQQFSLLDKKLDTSVDESRTMFNQLKDFLIKHENMEQTEWYPELGKNDALNKIIDELKKEEKNAADAIKKIDKITDNKEWASEVRKLKTDVLHHANEEQIKLFPKVKKDFNKAELQKIGEKLKNYHVKNNMTY